MSVHQLKDGRWFVQWRNPDPPPKRKRKYFGRGLENERQAREYDQQLGLRPYQKRTPKVSSPLFEELFVYYLHSKTGKLAPSTRSGMLYKMNAIILPQLGELQALDLTHHRMDQYVSGRIREGRKQTTVIRELSYITTILNFSVKRKIIPFNPLSGYDAPKRDDAVIQPVTPTELRNILRHAPPHLIRALVLAYFTGARPGPTELFSICWHDVDFENETIYVRSASKGGPRYRYVPIHPQLLKYLRMWESEDEDKGAPEIITYEGHAVKSLPSAFKTAKKRAGVTRRLPFYSFRHAFATGMLAGDGDLKSVSQMLGHSQPSITMRTYQHVDVDLKRKSINRLPTINIDDNT
jgi:integrase